MRQFDVLDNPVPRARQALPFVTILQSDLADTGPDRVVAPLAPTAAMPPFAGRLILAVRVDGRDYALLVPALTTLRARDLRQVVASLAAERGRILAALDYLFEGF
ncbi:MAG TPA: CcdB family protein [Geminicoccaceae bacterium]|nr:CcdB family protein [Geminicoccaceae bacterium]